MSYYLLDTNIIIGFLRGSQWASYIDLKYKISKPLTLVHLSTVTLREIYSLAIQFNWGDKKKHDLDYLLHLFPLVDINQQEIIEKYADIDAYSQKKHSNIKIPEARKMQSDNDIWIAATASVLNAKLITTDKDFDHLDEVFLKVIYIDQKLTPANV